MTADRIPALLEPIQDRLNAATPGPWGTIADTYKSTPVHRIGADVSGVTVAQVIDHGAQTARNAAFIANAPTDQARLLSAVQAVLAMHWQDTYGPRFCSCGEHWPCPTVRTVEAALTPDA